jgi:hypothetical protein
MKLELVHPINNPVQASLSTYAPYYFESSLCYYNDILTDRLAGWREFVFSFLPLGLPGRMENGLKRSLSIKRDSRVVHPGEIQHILTGGNMAAKPSPVEHIASPASPTHSVASAGRASFQSHSRNMSAATDPAAPRTNRFSLSFPIQPRASVDLLERLPTGDSMATVATEAAAAPTDTNFLTAIAAQERRVLEIKEELARAQEELKVLKDNYAKHQAGKARIVNREQIITLQPLQTTFSPIGDKEEDTDGSTAWMQQEMERRKALMNGGRTGNRTVFSGSRHTRTLSLLSPARENGVDPAARPQRLPPRKDSLPGGSKRSLEKNNKTNASPERRPAVLTRASTTSDLSSEVARNTAPGDVLPANLDIAAIDREALLRHGKKMASDFKDGLWNFWEDLRQATVGDEATQHMTVQPGAPLRRPSTQSTIKTAKKQSSRNSLRPSSRGSSVSNRSSETRRPSPQACKKHAKSATQPAGTLPDLADPGFWAEHGVAAPPQAAVKKSPTQRGHKKDLSKAVSVKSVEDPWDTWDDNTTSTSPKDSRSSSAVSEANTAATTVSGPNSPRPGPEKKDPIPWPALNKLGPASLRRTASHLMNEWEKSLTPSPGKEYRGEEQDLLGLSAEAEALESARKRD